jgi:hypothetical protein
MVAHGLAAAHAERVPELARLWGSLERAVTAGGADGPEARAAHAALSARFGEWVTADAEAERRDVVTLTADERDAMLRDIDHALPAAEAIAGELPPADEVHDVIRSLRELRAAFPTALPRAAAVRFRRSAARLRKLEALGAPAMIIGHEPGVLLEAIESGLGPIAPRPLSFIPERGFEDAFFWGLDACVICEPGASQGVNLGLGTSPALAALLGVAGEDHGTLHERWVEAAAPSHPFARHPFVPRGRFCTVRPAALVRADLEETGPIGWAAADEVGALARDFAAVASAEPAFAPELRAVAARMEEVSRRGHAVIGWIEYLSPEADGESRLFAEPDRVT